MFIATLWNAINDPIMGTIADRTHTKFGRYKPYFLFFPALLTIVSFFLFLALEGLSPTQKIIYLAVFYILYGMLVTVLTMPMMSVLSAQTKDNGERNKAVTLAGICIAWYEYIAFWNSSNYMSGYCSEPEPLSDRKTLR